MGIEGYITIQKVSKRFGATVAVNDVSLTIQQGEFFSLLGHSGCGKTTLLRILAGFELPTEGEILIDGVSMARVPAFRRPTNMVFQSHALFPHLTVQQNVGYGLRKEKLKRVERNRRVAQALKMVKLEDYGLRRPHQLSGGQCQRVALARALIKRPKVLLLDEPISALDKKLREAMQIELRELQRSVGITFLYVTHDQEEALTMSDRVAVMFDGQVVQVDSPRRLYDCPANRRVAGFIGQMNFLAAQPVASGDGQIRYNCQGLGTITPASGNSTPAARAVIAVRPEKMMLSTRPPADHQLGMAGRLQASAFLGDRVHHLVAVPDLAEPLMVSGIAGSAEDTIAEGSPVWAVFNPADLLVLKDE